MAVNLVSMVVTRGLSVKAAAWVCSAILWTSATAVQAAGNRSLLGDSDTVIYSTPLLDDSYNASAEFNPKGVEYLYFLTNAFLDAIQRDDTAALDQAQLEAAREAGNLTTTLVQLGLYDWRSLVQHHLGFAVLAAVGIVTALCTPFIGLIVCCCRCAGKCGGRAQPYDKKGDKCRRWCSGLALALLLLAIMMGAAASFLVNEYMEKGVTEVPARLHVAVDDSELYVNNTKLEVNHLLKTNFRELSQSLDTQLEECGQRVRGDLAAASQAVAVDNLTAIAEKLTDVQRDLTDIVQKSQRLQNKADQLDVGLQDAHAALAVLLRSCGTPRCRQMPARYNLSQLAVDNHFDQLPDLSGESAQLRALMEAGLGEEAAAGQQALDGLAAQIQQQVAARVPDIRSSVHQTGAELEEAAANITSVLDQVQLSPAHSAIQRGGEYLQRYGPFRYYVFLVVSGLVVLVALCLTLGLCCGVCGRRPGTLYGDEACNKATGANFLVSGAFLYFLLSWLLLLLVTALFLLGGLVQLYLCDGLQQPAAPGGGLAILQAVYPPQQLLPPLSTAGARLADVVSRCHQDQAIYTVLGLEPVYNVSQLRLYQRQLGLHQQLRTLSQRIDVDTDVELVTPRFSELLQQLSETNLAQINYTAVTAALAGRITSLDLDALGREVERAAEELPADRRDVATRLRNQAIILLAQHRVVAGMRDIVGSVRNTSALLREHLTFNGTNLTEAVVPLLAQAQQAQQYLRSRGRQQLTELAETFTEELTARLDTYSDRVEHAFRDSLGRCGPLSTVYNSTAVTLCSNVVYPFNAFWASVGWCLLLLIPCVILSLALTPLYRKSEPFSEGLMDTEYLYDAYGDSDNIPLASVRAGGRYRDTSRRRAASPDSPSYSSVPPRPQLLPVGAGGDMTCTEPKAPPLWELQGGPPGYPESPQPTRDRPPPYSPSQDR